MNGWLAAYQALFPAVGVAVAAKMLVDGRGRTLREGFSDLGQRLGRVPEPALDRARGALWLHGASVGEVAGAEVLLKALGRPALITTSTVVGREAASHLGPATLAPMDLLPAVRGFLDRVRPKALVVLETELWPATLAACVERGVPFALANARVTARSFPRYRWIRPLLAPALSRAAAVAAQTQGDADRLAALGVPADRILVAGNIKYDAVPPPEEAVAGARALLTRLGWRAGKERIWCAGSTRPGEEESAILDTFLEVQGFFPELRLILAPRHVERADEAAAELQRRGINFARVSNPAPAAQTQGPADCLLVDELGHLRALYAASELAFVGGTLAPVGGHNLLEPAASGVPVLFGPYTGSIEAPAEALERAGGFRVTAPDLGQLLVRLLGDPAALPAASRQAKETARLFAGAAARTAAFLIERLRLD